MAVKLYNYGMTAATELIGGAVELRNIGMQAATAFDAELYLQKFGMQVIFTPEVITSLQSIAMHVMVSGTIDPTTNSYAHPETFDGNEDDDMIYTDVIFPECIAYGSTGVPRYLTDKAEVLSGDEQRETRYRYPRHEYSINMENLPRDEIAQVMNIWHIVSGDYAGFLFLDPLDHTSGNTSTNLSPTEVTFMDQIVATASANVSEYPLFKYYSHLTRKKQRRIGFPKAGTLKVAIDGRENFSWEYDYGLRVLRFLKPVNPITKTTTKVGDVFTSSGNVFAGLQEGDLVFIDGFANALTNKPTGNPHRVRSKATNDEIQLENYDGSDLLTPDEADVAMYIESAYPPTGAALTAGFYFYVPVRFDDGDNAMSEITAGLRETAQANFTNIKLKEVFE